MAAKEAPEAPELTVVDYALSRGQRVDERGEVDSGVEEAYREYLARRAADPGVKN